MLRFPDSEKNKLRFLLALYISLFFHISFYLWSNYFSEPGGFYVCGFDQVPEAKDDSMDFDMSLNFEFGSGPEDGGSPKKSENEGDPDKNTPGDSLTGTDSQESKTSSFDSSKYSSEGWEKLIKNLESTKDLRKNYMESFDGIFPNSEVSGKYIYRKRDYEDMIVKEVFPTIYSIEKPFKEEIKESETVLENHNERNKIIEEFRKSQIDPDQFVKMEIDKNNKGSDKPKLQPLTMGEKEREEYFDQILKESKESQLQQFIDRFSGYDPDKGDLPFVYRDLYYKNLQRLAYTFSGDPTYFTSDYFQENLNKEDYLRNAMNLISKMKGTKTATEILFTVLDIYEIQERAIYQHFENETRWNTYSPEQKKQIRVETIRRVIEKYSQVFKEKNIKTYEDVTSLYFRKKLEIVDFLLNTTPEGYRKNDGHFEKGRLHWEKYIKTNDTSELNKAIGSWQKISSSDRNGDFINKDVFESMKTHLRNLNSNPTNSQIARDNITNLLYGRLSSALEKKRIREEKLLWPKGK